MNSDLSAVEDAVNVLDEPLVVHLAVVEEEDVVIGRLSRLLQDAFQRIAPLLETVLFAHLKLNIHKIKARKNDLTFSS